MFRKSQVPVKGRMAGQLNASCRPPAGNIPGNFACKKTQFPYLVSSAVAGNNKKKTGRVFQNFFKKIPLVSLLIFSNYLNRVLQ